MKYMYVAFNRNLTPQLSSNFKDDLDKLNSNEQTVSVNSLYYVVVLVLTKRSGKFQQL